MTCRCCQWPLLSCIPNRRRQRNRPRPPATGVRYRFPRAAQGALATITIAIPNPSSVPSRSSMRRCREFGKPIAKQPAQEPARDYADPHGERPTVDGRFAERATPVDIVARCTIRCGRLRRAKPLHSTRRWRQSPALLFSRSARTASRCRPMKRSPNARHASVCRDSSRRATLPLARSRRAEGRTSGPGAHRGRRALLSERHLPAARSCRLARLSLRRPPPASVADTASVGDIPLLAEASPAGTPPAGTLPAGTLPADESCGGAAATLMLNGCADAIACSIGATRSNVGSSC